VLIAVLIVIASIISSFYVTNSVGDEGKFSKPFVAKITKLDDFLIPTISATLTGLSLTGASFLFNLERGSNQDRNIAHVELARKSFINAFFMFLMCTIGIFLFDFLEILYEQYIVIETILDILITYAFFAAGTVYLVKAARGLHFTYGR